MTLADFDEGPFEVWPDCWQSLMVFVALRTQWRVGFSGPTGLDYSALPEVWRRTKTAPADRDDVFADIEVMQDAALEVMREK